MIDGGMEVISCGANVPFADKEIFMGPISKLADDNIAVIPDFIANCGMARVFAYLQTRDCIVKDVNILLDASEIIERAMIKVHQFNNKPTGLLSAKALELSIMTVMKGEATALNRHIEKKFIIRTSGLCSSDLCRRRLWTFLEQVGA